VKTKALDAIDKELIAQARELLSRVHYVGKDIHLSVGSALRSASGKQYLGVNIHNVASAPSSVCAEMSAVSNMASGGEREVERVVAVRFSKDKKRWNVIPSCGVCREVLSAFGNPWVIISKSKKARLSELYPLDVSSNTLTV